MSLRVIVMQPNVRSFQASASVLDWQNLCASFKALDQIRYAVANQMGDFELPPILQTVLENFSDKLHNLFVLIESVVDFPESKLQRRLVVVAGVDEDLDEEKRCYEGLGNFLVLPLLLCVHYECSIHSLTSLPPTHMWLDRRMLRSKRWIVWMMTAVTCISQSSSFPRLAISSLFQGHRVSTGPRPLACQFTSGPGPCLLLHWMLPFLFCLFALSACACALKLRSLCNQVPRLCRFAVL